MSSMMSPEHLQQMYILIGVVVAIFVVIMGTLIMSQLKRKPLTELKTEDTKALPQDTLKDTKDILAKKSADPLRPAPELVRVGKDTAPEKSAAVETDVDLKSALRKTEENFFGRIRGLFTKSGENTNLEEIEEVLYTSDLGPKTVQALMEMMEDKLGRKELRDPESVRGALKTQLLDIFSSAGPLEANIEKPMAQLQRASQGPTVYMVVGVNGAGKTTSIGKMAAQMASEGQKVLVAAGDTFRAAAGAQLKVWTERAQVDIFHPEGITDPGAVAFDAVSKAQAQGYDTVIIDTAGRLHTQSNLMAELQKVKRVMQKVVPDAPHECLIVLDANSGQNALMQAKEFHKAVTLTGAILTKMDGTAKGGVAVGLVNELGIPVKMIGVGERIRDLRPFAPKEFVDSILGI